MGGSSCGWVTHTQREKERSLHNIFFFARMFAGLAYPSLSFLREGRKERYRGRVDGLTACMHILILTLTIEKVRWTENSRFDVKK